MFFVLQNKFFLMLNHNITSKFSICCAYENSDLFTLLELTPEYYPLIYSLL